MRVAASVGMILLALAFPLSPIAAQEPEKPVFDERAPCAAVDAACEQMAEIRAETIRGLPWGVVPGVAASLFQSDSLREFGSRGIPDAKARGSRAEVRRTVDTRDERRIVRLEWRYAYSLGDGRVAREYATAELDSASGAWLSARWAAADPGGRIPSLAGKNGTSACVSWTRDENIRVVVGAKLAKLLAPSATESMKWLPWPVATLSYLASGGGNAYSSSFMTPLWGGVETVAPIRATEERGSTLRWTSTAGIWSIQQGAALDDISLIGGLSGSGIGEPMKRMQDGFFRSTVLDDLIASCP